MPPAKRAAFQRGTFADALRSTMDPAEGGVIASFQDWDLDGAGNWRAFFDDTTTTQTRTHSDFNEIVGLGGATLVHDKNGNLTDDASALVLKWDALNRLREARRKSDNSLIAVYAYDAKNRRMRKTVSNGGVGNDSGLNGITDFYYDGWRVVEEREPDLQAGTDVTVRQMTHGIYLDEVWTVDARRDGSGGAVSVAMLNDGALGAGGGGGESHRVFCHANTLYHVCGVSDETGALREAFQYDPYGGHTRIADGPDADAVINFGADDARTAGARSAFGVAASFTGQRFDPETGLHYYKNRYYSSRLGRFVSRDPITCARACNLLEYVSSTPVESTDSLGQMREPIVIRDPDPTPVPPMDSSTCQSRVDEAMQDEFNRLIMEDIAATPGCMVPPIGCRSCCESDSNIPQNTAMYFDYNSMSISVCSNRYYANEPLTLPLRHELIHAWDTCKGGVPGDCGGRACQELRAQQHAGVCHLYSNNSEEREKCIKDSALKSLPEECRASLTNADPKSGRSRIDELYEVCQ